MFVKYSPKVSHIKVIPLLPLKEGNSFDNDSVTLRPGTNELTEKEWEAIQPHIQNQIGKEIVPFTVPVNSTKGSKGKQAGTLRDVPLATARKIIQACQDPNTLKKWFNQELSDELILVLAKRMRKLNVEPDDLEDGEDGLELKDGDITPEGGNSEDDKPAPGKGKSRKENKPEQDDEDDLEDGEDGDGEDEVPDFDGTRSQ